MRICSLILIVALGGTSRAAELKFDAAATAKALAPFVDESTLIVVRLDLQNADSDALVKLLEPLALKPEAKKFLSTCKEWLTEYRKLGGKEIYSIYGASDFPNIPLLLTALPADPEQQPGLAKLVQALYAGRQTGFDEVNGFTCFGPHAALERLKAKKPVARPEIEEALVACGARLAQVVITPSAQARKVFEEMLPNLPQELGGGSVTTFTRDLKWLALSVGHTPKVTVRLLLQTKSEASAQKIGGKLEMIVPHIAKELPQADDPKAEALRKFVALCEGLVKPTVTDPDRSRLVIAADLEKLVPELVKLVNEANARPKKTSLRDLTEIGSGCYSYESSFSRFPAHIRDKTGKPLLSWRVAILPFIDQSDLYKQFHLDEPWDSAHNIKLLARMPEVYRSPLQNPKFKERTTYLAPRGKGLAWDDPEGVKINSITGGTSNTILVVEADDEHAVEWTKPDDIEIDPKDPTKGLIGHYKTSFAAVFCDGHVQMVNKSQKRIYALFTRAADSTAQE